jgi:hypothetical protein
MSNRTLFVSVALRRLTHEQLRVLPALDRSPLAVTNNSRTNTTINGMRPSFTNVTMEGINVQDNYIRTKSPGLFAESLAAGSDCGNVGFDLEYERGSGQRRCTNFVHRTFGHQPVAWRAFVEQRKQLLASNTWFNNRNNVAIPFLNQNSAGGSLGGHMIKDKLFFYGN